MLKDGRTLKKYFCIDCNNEICWQTAINGQARCQSCAVKKLWEDKIFNGKSNSDYKDGRTLEIYYCKGCGEQICYQTAIDGQGRCSSCCHKNLWQDEKYRDKTIKAQREGMKIKPNKPEKLLNKILQKILPEEYKYNKTFIIAGLVPDFVNKKKKKIIELYGCYWHKCSKCEFGNGRKEDKNRVGIYNLFVNYKTLIIWQHELKDMDKLKTKILEFNKL